MYEGYARTIGSAGGVAEEIVGKTMTQYAIRWVLNQPAIVSAILGVETAARIDAAVAAAA